MLVNVKNLDQEIQKEKNPEKFRVLTLYRYHPRHLASLLGEDGEDYQFGLTKLILDSELYKEASRPDAKDNLKDIDYIKVLNQNIVEQKSQEPFSKLPQVLEYLEQSRQEDREPVEVDLYEDTYKDYLSPVTFYNKTMDVLSSYQLELINTMDEMREILEDPEDLNAIVDLQSYLKDLIASTKQLWTNLSELVELGESVEGEMEYTPIKDLDIEKRDVVSNEIRKSIKQMEGVKSSLENRQDISQESIDFYQNHIGKLDKRYGLNLKGDYTDPFGSKEYNREVTKNLVQKCIDVMRTKQRLF